MNGISLLLIAATFGVEYNWQSTDDGQIEYVLIVEPDFLTSLAEGSEIRSSVPPELESVQRLCIRIAQPAKNGIAPPPTATRKLSSESFRNSRVGLRAATEPTTLFWKAVAPQPEVNQLVRYGWQPTKEGTQEYFVQIDPKLLRTLQPGDEIYTTLSAEAGRTDTFVVFSNSKQLPKVPGRPAAAGAPVAGLPTTPGAMPGGPAPFAPAPFSAPPLTNGPAGPPAFGPPIAPTSPPYAPPRTFGAINDDPAMDTNPSRVNPATGYEPAPAPYSPATSGFQPPGTGRSNLNNAGLNGPISPPENFRNDGYGSSGLRNPPLAGNNQPLPNNDPYRRDLNPPLNPGMNPPQNDLFPAGGYQNNPGGNFRPNSPQPPMNNGQYRAADYPPETNLVGNNGPRPYNENPPPGAPAIDYRPTSNPGNNDNQFASLPNNGNTLRPGMRDELRTNPAAPVVPAEKPWWTLVFTAFGLFLSIGANLYLGWTAAEFYSRYRLAVERLRTSGRS